MKQLRFAASKLQLANSIAQEPGVNAIITNLGDFNQYYDQFLA
jgi:hypothetical protein